MSVLDVLVGVTVGLGGFLLFLVEPMMGKYILPWFGGSASTWSVCLLFFQTALLVGYFYAHAVSQRFSLRTQTLWQLALLAGAALMLPIEPSESWKPIDADAPVQRILATLAASVGAPYAVLATTSPLLQRWMSLLHPGRQVTKLFALSNFGSFVGLLSYPFAVEPLLWSSQQTMLWSYAFGGYAICFSACAVLTLQRAREIAPATPSAAPSGGTAPSGLVAWISGDAPVWIGWATGGTVLLLASTNLVTEWITVIPFFWVLPLALYLLTFVLAFASPRYYRREIYLPLFILFASGSLFIGKPETTSLLLAQIVLLSSCMFCGCMICHGELAAKVPEARRLPGYYLAISFGGFLGGALVAFVAPAVLRDVWEYHIGIVAIVVAAIHREIKTQGALARRMSRPALLAVGSTLFLFPVAYVGRELSRPGAVIWQARNFYGVVKVIDNQEPLITERQIAMFQSGENQGDAWVDPALSLNPECDFSEKSALGFAQRYIAARRANGPNAPIRIGYIGLGVGMALGYAKAGDVVRLYELNPAVWRAASDIFPFIKNTKATVEVALGDGRLSLERELKSPDFQKFDLIVLDAFRGSSPPMHLMTKEAFDIYLAALKPDGILIADLDLWNFELSPLLRGLSQKFNLPAGWFDSPSMLQECDFGISWVLYTRDEGFWKVKRVMKNRSDWPDHGENTILWTDKSTNLLSVLRWGR
ncbi:MAG TPA: hypothetical protein VEH76_07840 [Methylocystis sp.]|nr:hypothetical protein [Methylocystis sp.]